MSTKVADAKKIKSQVFLPGAVHWLVVSVAINLGLLLKLIHDGNLLLEWSNLPDKENGTHLSSLSSYPPEPKPANDGQIQQKLINLDHGDPTMYQSYWKQMGDRTTVVITGWQSVSYFSDTKNLCWFLEPAFANAVTRLHNLVGNAETENRHIVVGTGSTQLFQAVLYALCPSDAPEPMSIVSAAPYYSSYPLITECLKSGLYKWRGDANDFDKEEPYIELVTYPNNPDGEIREAVFNGNGGILVHDLAYYWPQYTPISSRADHDIMLFTLSKSTGHAGMRLGWALVKDEAIARKMVKFIEISSIGVSKDSQVRAAKILDVISDTYEDAETTDEIKQFFDYGYQEMAKRWTQLREAANKGQSFSLPNLPVGKCNFSNRTFGTQPAFAWLKCEKADDCESFLKKHKILTRGGAYFGSSKKYVRASLIGHLEDYNEFIRRLSLINSMESP
ncbi:tryptophan aminotransferase-related protein 1-like [Lycium ferocissimum]|uniref:tryptophan aminotransferase-related protein 1-like n=1 Tax=Lycium ferocissimum TaxID=112874 RepID=UPI0028168A0E|nr:tryptophan aminotransferase-related protein 1-like [Lycium ferocissimum]